MRRVLSLLAMIPGLGAARSVLGLAAAPVRWLLGKPYRLIIAALVVQIAVHNWITIPRLRVAVSSAQVAAARAKTDRDTAQRKLDSLQAAARAATAVQAANIARVKAERDTINERTADAYEARLRVLRARADAVAERLRRSPALDPGVSSPTGLPTALDAAGSVAEAPGDHGLPDAAGNGCAAMSLHERLIASEQAEQLLALIDAVEAQAAVRTAP